MVLLQECFLSVKHDLWILIWNTDNDVKCMRKLPGKLIRIGPITNEAGLTMNIALEFSILIKGKLKLCNKIYYCKV